MIVLGAYLFLGAHPRKGTENKGKLAGQKVRLLTSDARAAVMASVRPNLVPRRGLRIYRAFGVVGPFGSGSRNGIGRSSPRIHGLPRHR